MSLTSTKRKQKEADHERSHAIASSEHFWSSTTNYDDMSKTTDEDTDHDGFVAAELYIGNISSVDRDDIRKEEEEQHKGVGEFLASSECSSRLLRACWRGAGSVPTCDSQSRLSSKWTHRVKRLPAGRGNSMKLEKTVWTP